MHDPLSWARSHLFSLGVNDGACRLSCANMVYGMAKINSVLAELGYPPDTTFIGTPDLTITRNSARWKAGFGYGGKLMWGDGDRPLTVLDVKPNACGMLVGGLSDIPDMEQVLKRLADLQETRTTLMGIPIAWDFARGNHFLDICRLESTDPNHEFPPYAFVLHGSCPEMHGPTDLGPGMYWDSSDVLVQQARLFTTPWGPLHVLLDDNARQYSEFCDTAVDFAAQRRLIAARHCFGDFTVISNTCHQSMQGPNCILLGCQSTTAGPGGTPSLLPIMIRSDLPGYIFEGLPGLHPTVVADMGFDRRDVSDTVKGRLTSADVLPHGAGYCAIHLNDVIEVIEMGDRRFFVTSTGDSQTPEVIVEPRDLPISYRGRQPVLRSIECSLGRMAGKLTPLYVIKV